MPPSSKKHTHNEHVDVISHTQLAKTFLFSKFSAPVKLYEVGTLIHCPWKYKLV